MRLAVMATGHSRLSRTGTMQHAPPPAKADFRPELAMNIHQSYALTSRPGTNELLRSWTAITRTAFFCGILLTDIGVILSMAWLTGVAYHLVVHHYAGDVLSYLEVGATSAIIFVIPNLFRGEYALPNFFSFRPHLRRTIQLWSAAFIGLLALGFFAQMSALYSRGWIALFYGSTICVLLAIRYALVQVTALASRSGLLSAQRIFLIGTGREIDAFIGRYRPWTLGANVVGCQFLTPIPASAPAEIRRAALARDLDKAVHGARSVEPDAIFVVVPWSATETIDRCAETFMALPAEIHLAPERVLDRFENVQLSKLGPLASLQLTRLPLSRFEQIEKRAFDLVFAAVGLILLTPLFAVVAVLIKLDSRGPVFFLQRRFGFNQKQFRIIKFRTMDALDDGAVVPQAKRNDPRVTRVGAWLRRWNIDEMPQLFNVLTGDMSLVGPRPHALSHDREYEQRIALYARRHNVKPGITGWAQMHGLRGETDTDDKMQKRVEYDLFYIDNWSPWLDLQILVRTVFSRSSYRNAY
jgi:Undecaprenyl-phosphate glucose phosphotransferase